MLCIVSNERITAIVVSDELSQMHDKLVNVWAHCSTTGRDGNAAVGCCITYTCTDAL